MWNARLFIVVAALAAAVLAIVWSLYANGGDGVPAGFATGNGRVEADQVDVSTKAAGRVAQIMAQEGDLVEQGQLLAAMDVRELTAQLNRARADVDSADSAVNQAKAVIEQRRSEQALAQQEFDRATELAERGVASQQVVDQAAAELKSTVAALDASIAALHTQERTVDAARALVDLYQTQIDDAQLSAPVQGRVLYRLAQPGEVLAAGGRLLTLLDFGQVYMEVFLPNDQTAMIRLGSEARIQLDGVPVAVPAYVSFISPEAQFTPRQIETRSERDKLMFRVKLRVPQELVTTYIEYVRTGMRGEAYIRLSDSDDAPWPEAVQTLIPETPPADG